MNTYMIPCFPGPPHVAREDDVYEGYAIPKGSLVIPNMWYVFYPASTF